MMRGKDSLTKIVEVKIIQIMEIDRVMNKERKLQKDLKEQC